MPVRSLLPRYIGYFGGRRPEKTVLPEKRPSDKRCLPTDEWRLFCKVRTGSRNITESAGGISRCSSADFDLHLLANYRVFGFLRGRSLLYAFLIAYAFFDLVKLFRFLELSP